MRLLIKQIIQFSNTKCYEEESLSFLMVLLLMPINCYGQGLFEASVSSNKSIVRVWSDPLMVIYNQTGIDRQFILWDNGNAIGTAIDIPTSDVTINDF